VFYFIDIILLMLKLVSNKIDTYLTSLWRHERYLFSVFRGILSAIFRRFPKKLSTSVVVHQKLFYQIIEINKTKYFFGARGLKFLEKRRENVQILQARRWRFDVWEAAIFAVKNDDMSTRNSYKGRSPYNGRLSDFSFYIDSQISVHRKYKKNQLII
jgi:hypothetical protein